MLKSISEYCKTAALAVVIAGCGTVSTRHQGMQVFTANDTIPLRDTTAGSLASFLRDTVILAESCNEEDVIVNEYLLEQLKPIRKNFRRINGVTRWTSIRKRDLWQSTEGGVARYYYLNGNLEKVVARHFGETGQKLSEYYLMKGQLSFVFEKQYRYNRPMYYDSASMKANNDTVAFAFEDSEITEDRSYFDKGKMVHIVLSGDCGAPFAASFLASEEERIKADFTGLLALVRKNR